MADILPPLVVDDSMLAIPKASATQDGYLSKHDFILFSGGEVVPVTSFNTRTGEVILLEDDVLAALGYVPLNKHGDTMTGPLTLAGAPTAALHAVTKGYVDGGAAALLPGEYLVTNFGASGSELRFLGGINSGSTTLTLTAAHEFKVGQGIFITGAGAAGADLLTKVDAVAGTVLTLHAPASTTRTSTNVQHDDTVAIQTTINAAFDAGGGTVYFPAGFYRVNGPFTDYNSILKIPYSPQNNPAYTPPNGPVVALSLVGLAASGSNFYGTLPPPPRGVFIQTDKIGLSPFYSIIAAGLSIADNPANVETSVTNVFLQMEGLCFRTYDNPQISAVDMGLCAFFDCKNINIDTGLPTFAISEPTHGTTAFRLPVSGASGLVNTSNVYIQGYAIGVSVGEIWTTTGTVACFMCQTAYRILTGWDGTGGMLRIGGGWCPKIIEIAAQAAIDLTVVWESFSGPEWYTAKGTDFYDPSNLASGVVQYFMVANPGHIPAIASRVGFQNVDLINCYGLEHRIIGPLNVSGSLTATTELITSGLSLWNQPVSFGPEDSGATGYRLLRIPNAAGVGGERSQLYNSGAGREAPFTGSAASLMTGLVSFWNLNEATGVTPAVDAQSVNPLTVYNSPTSSAGRVGNALSFNGSNQILEILDGDQTGLSGGDVSYTISLWVYLEDKVRDYFIVTRSHSSATNGPDYVFSYDLTSDNFLFGSQNTDGSYNVIKATSFGSPPVGQWIHVVIWQDATARSVNIQVNNGSVNSLDFTGKTPRSDAGKAFYLAAYVPGAAAQNYMFGRLDAVGFWNRVLTA